MHVVLVPARASYTAKLIRSKRAEVLGKGLQYGQSQSDELQRSLSLAFSCSAYPPSEHFKV